MSVLLPHPVTGELFTSPVQPGTGWPGDPADEATQVARDASDVASSAADATLPVIDACSSVCCACPRLVSWRESVAVTKRASFADQPYWGRPVPGWGDETPRVLVLGLAPAANGGNRTGRIFTGDRSGDWLFAALHRAGLATKATSTHAADGQHLVDTRMVAAVRCAPPDNKPTVTERDTCALWLQRELTLAAPSLRVVVCLGSFGWDAALRNFRALGYDVPRPKPRFVHGATTTVSSPERTITVLASYHPSQQNTFTGTLTEAMLDKVLSRARALADR